MGYRCSEIKKKYRYGKFDCYRFVITSESLPSLYKDIESLKKKFPTCGLANKSKYLKQIVKIRNKNWKRRSFKVTKKIILKVLKNKRMTSRELSAKVNINLTSVREHLLQLEKKRDKKSW
ncbi:MAG: winged helix-turn-helix domain-containing protein [Candidatus Aenigmatarchaeota archaeon]